MPKENRVVDFLSDICKNVAINNYKLTHHSQHLPQLQANFALVLVFSGLFPLLMKKNKPSLKESKQCHLSYVYYNSEEQCTCRASRWWTAVPPKQTRILSQALYQHGISLGHSVHALALQHTFKTLKYWLSCSANAYYSFKLKVHKYKCCILKWKSNLNAKILMEFY